MPLPTCSVSPPVSERPFSAPIIIQFDTFNGFDVVQRYGDYDETQFNSNSPKQFLFCRKTSETIVLA